MLDQHDFTKWSNRLAFDVALRLEGSGEDMQDILLRHNRSTMQLVEYSKDPVFDQRVKQYREEIRDKGVTFKLKARAQAEELLKTSWALIHDVSVSPAVKADLIKSTVKWAGLEPKNDAPDTGGTGGVRIMINLGGTQVETRLIDSTAEESQDAA